MGIKLVRGNIQVESSTGGASSTQQRNSKGQANAGVQVQVARSSSTQGDAAAFHKKTNLSTDQSRLRDRRTAESLSREISDRILFGSENSDIHTGLTSAFARAHIS